MSDSHRRVADRVQHMLEAIGNARSDIGDLSKDQFLADGKTQRAVIESIIVVGEAANKIIRLAPSIERRNPVLWQQFRDSYDTRIVLTHSIFEWILQLSGLRSRTIYPNLKVFSKHLLTEVMQVARGRISTKSSFTAHQTS